jgi:hypothetical protein
MCKEIKCKEERIVTSGRSCLRLSTQGKKKKEKRKKKLDKKHDLAVLLIQEQQSSNRMSTPHAAHTSINQSITREARNNNTNSSSREL